ncbi:MAG: PEP-CTERM sorting domain-containing protein [Alphaproteobacteria bacterium]
MTRLARLVLASVFLVGALAAGGRAQGALSSTFSPNATLPNGQPGYLLQTFNGAGGGPKVLFNLIPGDSCIPTEPCKTQALDLSDAAAPNIFNGTDRLGFEIFFGIETADPVSIPGDPCQPYGGNGFAIGGFNARFGITSDGQIASCSAQLFDTSNSAFQGFSAALFSFAFAADPPATATLFLIDPTGVPLSFALVPEPGGLALFVAGLTGLGLARRRRKDARNHRFHWRFP